MYIYIITEEFIVNIYDPSGSLIDYPGPWQSYEDAKKWADMRIEQLNSNPTEGE